MSDTATRTMLLHVEGMSCGGCEERIGKVLSRLNGVGQTGADHCSGEVRVTFDAAQVTPGAVAGQIERAGFRVTKQEAVS